MRKPLVRRLSALVCAVVIFYWRILLTRQFSLLTQAENVTQAYSWFTFWIVSLKNRTLPLWDPFIFGGRSFPGEMQTAAFYPLHLLLALPPLNRHGLLSPQIYHVYFVFAHLLAALFLFALVRELRLNYFSALLAALCFSLGGFVARASWPHLLESAAWLPLAFLFLLRSLRSQDARRSLSYAAGAGLAMGMAILAGGLHVAIMQPIAMGSAALFAAMHPPTFGLPPGRTAWVRSGAAIVISFLVAIGAGAVQILPSLEYSARAIRFLGTTALPATEKIPYADLHDGLFPNALATFFIGDPSGPVGSGEAVSPYLGVLPILLAIIAVWKCRQAPLVRYFAGLALAAFLFSLGSFSLVHGIAYAVIPYLWMAREASRFLYLSDFAIALLAAYGAELVFAGFRKQSDWAGVVRGLEWLAGGAGIALAVPALFGKVELGPWIAFSLLLTLIACALLGAAIKGRPGAWLQWAAIGLVLFDLNGFDWTARNRLEIARSGVDQLERLVSAQGAAAFLHSQAGPFRVQTVADTPNIGDAFRIQTTTGGAVTYPINYLNFLGLGDRAYDLLNVRYRMKPAAASDSGAVYRDAHWAVFENAGAFPRGWVVHQTEVAPSQPAALARVASPDIPLDRVAILERPIESSLQPRSGADPEPVTIDRYQSNRFDMTVHARTAGLLVIGEIFYPGWHAAVNGRPVRIYQVDGALRGIVVPAGISRIHFRYVPFSVIAGGAISGATFLGALILWAAARRYALKPAVNPIPAAVVCCSNAD